MPAPPTVVTPRSDSIRPPELAAIADAPVPADRYASSRSDSHPIDDHSPASTWNPSTSRSETASVDPPKSATTTPPNLLTTPAPISPVDDRYAARAEPESTNRSNLDHATTDQAAAPPITPAPTVTTPIASTETSSTAKPYSSAYPNTTDDKSSAPPPVTTTPVEIPVAKPLPQVAQDPAPQTDNRYRENAFSRNNSSTSRYDAGLQPIDSAPSQYAAQPVADYAATQPSSGYPPNAARSSSQFLPSTAPSNSYNQPNSYNSGTPYSSGRYGAPPPTSPANPWNAAGNSPPAAQQQYGNPDQRMGNSTPGGSANIYGNVSAASPPVQRDGDQYTVAPNDSFWAISQKTYGSGAYFKALYEHNRKRMKDPNDLKVGQTLSVPDEATLRRLYPDLCPKPRKPEASPQQRMITAGARTGATGRMYTVADGDTLFEIARHELGKPSRWAEIYQLNRDVLGEDFDYLRPGTQLILPADAAPAGNPANRFDSHGGNTATRQPDAFYPR